MRTRYLLAAFVFLLAAAPIWAGTVYYVDSAVADIHVASGTPDFTTYNHLTFEMTGGSDSVYCTIEDLNAKTFSAGDTICFRKGQTWTPPTGVPFRLDDSGTAANPITVTSFGTGNKPVLRNPVYSSGNKKAIYAKGDYQIFDGLDLRNTVDKGIDLYGNHCIVRNCDISDVGVGAEIWGRYNLITNNYIHNLIMVYQVEPADDYGAEGVGLRSTDNEVSYNTIAYNLIHSYDYPGGLGQAIDFFYDCSRSYLHHNFVYQCHGFLEAGDTAAAYHTVSDVRIEYNILLNSGRFSTVNNNPAEPYYFIPANWRVYNNTIVSVDTHDPNWTYDAVVNFKTNCTAGQYIFRNNLIYCPGTNWRFNRITSASGWDHDHNLLYTRPKDSQTYIWNFTADATDIIDVDPLLVNSSGTRSAAEDCKLQAGSPCINSGTTMPGIVYDFDGHPVPSGAATDIGAYEYAGQFYLPAVTTSPATSITPTSATAGGNVTSDGGATVTERGVCWGLTENPAISGSHTQAGSGTGSFTTSLTGLSQTMAYHVRAYATNSLGTSYGTDVTFTTLQEITLPSVTTSAATSITPTSATVGGNVTSDGGAVVTERGVCWGLTANPTISGSHTQAGSGWGSFTASLTGLTAATTYHVRAYATNSKGTGYGSDVTFTTLQDITPPSVTTSTATSITSTGATGGGNVTSDGGATVTARGVCWGLTANPTISGSHTQAGSGTGSYTSSLTGLTPSTTYHVRAYATNSSGTSYGNDVTFKTVSETAKAMARRGATRKPKIIK